MLLVCWQLKRHLDMLHFSAQRICHFRPASFDEDETLKGLKRNADVLEFFENFYAAVLQVILQLYIYFGQTDWLGTGKVEARPRKLRLDHRIRLHFSY